ncbi:MAG: NFYB/HAP3 family transcription factor subunit [Candidatus Nanoarchaeia archaeon]|nr:NFYB/HAP3 family transcription factor subunit [Candidatus Nanoarchaeia archaeon]MDD5587991.1 NFYB/HAP3 family transcription factor subunit [Candidatus Nanoarchaeia archaeon]
MKGILPLAAMEKLLKKAGAPRVSDDAKRALAEILEDYADQISDKAIKIAQHSKRKTVKAGDVKLAVK